MSDNTIQLNEDIIKHDLKDLVRSSPQEGPSDSGKLKEMKLGSAVKSFRKV